MGCAALEETGKIGCPHREGNQVEIHGVNLKGFDRADIGMGTIKIDHLEKLAVAFRREKHGRICGE